MNKEKQEQTLQISLSKLEKAAQLIVNTRGYTRDVQNIKVLIEMIREQLINEKFNHSTRRIG